MKTRLLELLAKIFCSGYLGTFYVFSDEISAAILLVKVAKKLMSCGGTQFSIMS